MIAYGVGGSLETVRGAWEVSQADRETTGTYLNEQTAEAFVRAIERRETVESRFDPQAARSWASRFATPLFLERCQAYVLSKVPATEAECAEVTAAAAMVLH